MGHDATLKVAIDLMHFPSQVRRFRSAPLPAGVLILLRIASGDEAATRYAAESVGCPSETLREAAVFFVEQMLLFPSADSYRVLGASPQATARELRRNMALLLRWLHPDLDRQGERSVFVTRVTRAWNDLKTRDRRAAYDRLRRLSPAGEPSLSKKAGPPAHSKWQRPSQGALKSARYGRPFASRQALRSYSDVRRGLLHRILLFLFGRAAS
jgi:hypothetical protein